MDGLKSVVSRQNEPLILVGAALQGHEADLESSMAELRRLIIDGGDLVDLGERQIRLLNPKRSLELLER